MITTVLDSGPLIAAFNANDKHHAAATGFLAAVRGRLLLPTTALTEVCWALERWPRVEAAFIGQVIGGAFELVQLTEDDLTRTRELILQYADFPLGTVDASVVAIAERYSVDRVATLDHRHFRAIKPKHVPALTLLP